MISVVIPYFQRSEGILRKALASIAAQRGLSQPVHVVVVDDASPVPAAAETQGLAPQPYTLHIERQANGGPGAARNKALDLLPEQTRYVAFLDSDDEWTPEHLARATTALESGYDFYFADHYQLDQNVSAFARTSRLQLQNHAALPQAAQLHAYSGDMLDQIIRGNLIGTSTVVYRRAPFADQRFKVEFTNAGEDYLFWMELAHRGARIAFSTQCEARYGRGVNIYSGSQWGSEQHMLRVHNEFRYRKVTSEMFPVTQAQRNHLRSAMQALRVDFAQDLLHMLVHRQAIPRALLAAHLKLDPISFAMLPIVAVRRVLRGARAP